MRPSWTIAVIASGCFAATPPAGVPCDPAAPTCPAQQACIATAGGFACLPEGTPPAPDAAPFDAAPPDIAPSPVCGTESTLAICFDFDAPVLTSPLANEGRIAISAALANVGRIDHGTGGAAQLGATSTIVLPVNTAIVGIVTIEASINLEVAVPDGTRVGILDSDDSTAGLSMYVFGTPAGHQVRCTLNGPDLFAAIPLIVGEWITLACTCSGDLMTAFANGIQIASQADCNPGAADNFGLTVGQNNQGSLGPPNEPMLGAIDDVRLSTAP